MNTQVQPGTDIVPTGTFKVLSRADRKALRIANAFGFDEKISHEIMAIAKEYRGSSNHVAKFVAGGMTLGMVTNLYEIRGSINTDNRESFSVSLKSILDLQDLFPGFVSVEDDTETVVTLIEQINEEFPTGLWGFLRAARKLDLSSPWDVIEWRRTLYREGHGNTTEDKG